MIETEIIALFITTWVFIFGNAYASISVYKALGSCTTNISNFKESLAEFKDNAFHEFKEDMQGSFHEFKEDMQGRMSRFEGKLNQLLIKNGISTTQEERKE